MKQETMYPTPEQVIDAIQTWRQANADEYRIISIHPQGDSIRSFSVTLAGPNTMQLAIRVMPGFSVGGWYAHEPKLVRIGDYEYNHDLKVYSDNLKTLMQAYPHNAIVSLDNEDYAYPEGHPVFGYAAIDANKNIIAFIQHPRNADPEEPDYTFNPFLPHNELVTDEHMMETLTANESPRIRGEWVDDEREWWA